MSRPSDEGFIWWVKDDNNVSRVRKAVRKYPDLISAEDEVRNVATNRHYFKRKFIYNIKRNSKSRKKYYDFIYNISNIFLNSCFNLSVFFTD